MDVKECKVLAIILEDAICVLVDDFRRATGLDIKRINIDSDTIGQRHLTVDVEMPRY